MDGGACYVRLDAEYLLHVRPFLSDGEARVYEAAMLACDGWDRPTSAAALSTVTRLHLDSVRRALRSLEILGLIRTRWIGAATSPRAQRAIEILRQYGSARTSLAAQKRRSVGDRARAGQTATASRAASASSGSHDPELAPALDRSAQRLWIVAPRDSGSGDPDPSLARSPRSDPDPPSLPSHVEPTPSAASSDRSASKGGRVVSEDRKAVPDELVALCRRLWTTNVTRKAARRYLGPLLAIGTPAASVEELERYLRASANANRVQSARFPIAVACMPEEFADWLERSRRLRLVPPARASPQVSPATADAHALSFAELGARAKEFCSRLARTDPGDARPTEIVQSVIQDQEGAAP